MEVGLDLGFIFQMHNLFEALSAYENVKMAAQLRDAPTTELRRRGTGILQRLGSATGSVTSRGFSRAASGSGSRSAARSSTARN